MYQTVTGNCRKFIYDFENANDVDISALKTIRCKYHIMKFEKSGIKGYIYFENARTLTSMKKLLNNNNVIGVIITHQKVLENYRIGNYWENGVIPKQGRKKDGSKDTDLDAGNTNNNDQPDELVITNKIMSEAMMNLLKESIELRNVFIESNRLLQEEIKELKQTQVITVSNNSNNVIEKVENNKTFNINVFLNEECKNAISLKEFVETIEIQESDLFYAKNNGLVEAITNIFQRELLNYEVNKRPVHCTDVKREILHIKETDGWVRESAFDSTRFQRAITYIADQKIKKLSEYVEKHPEMKNVRSPEYEEGLKMMIGIMGGTEHPNVMKKKVQKNIAKVVYLSKNG